MIEGYSLAIREGFRNFRRGRTLSFAMIACIAVAVFAIGVLGLIAVNVTALLKGWESRVELVAFLSREIEGKEAERVLEEVIAIPEVEGGRLITSSESWDSLFSDASGSLELGEIRLEEVLPASIVVRLLEGDRNLASIQKVAAEIALIEGVDEVSFEETLLNRYMQLREDLAAFAVGTSIFWALVFGLITASIARLASAARGSEVYTLRMLGANSRFVRRTFAVEGLAQGFCGSAIGIGALVCVGSFLAYRMGGALQLPASVFVVIFGVGPVLGLLANWFLFRSAFGLAVAVLLVSVPTVVVAQTKANLDSEIARRRKELTRLEKELENTRTSAVKIAEEEKAVIDELDEIERALDTLKKEIETGEKNIRSNKTAITRAQSELARYEGEYNLARKELERWLRLLCNHRQPGMIEVILSDMPQSEITLRRKAVSLLVAKKSEAFDKARRLHNAVLGQQQALRQRLELDTLYADTAKVRAQQASESKEKRTALLSKLRAQKSIHMAAIRDLESSARRLHELLESYQNQASSAPDAAIPFREMRGLLLWPTEGEISVPFGRVKNPGSRTYIRHLGVDISADFGSEIRAIHDAVVAYCDWFRGYGKLVILDHGDGYNSVYSHCSEILVQRGESVAAGQPIAFVGETGSLKGPFLYFEIRENGQAVDPIAWLQRRNLHETQSK